MENGEELKKIISFFFVVKKQNAKYFRVSIATHPIHVHDIIYLVTKILHLWFQVICLQQRRHSSWCSFTE